MNKYYHIVTYGCQMNVHESEKIAGILADLGYKSCDSVNSADIVVFNTCCIRENAENHAFGNIGMLKKLKSEKKDMIIAVGGCLPQQMGKAENLHDKFPNAWVNITYGCNNFCSYCIVPYVRGRERSRKSENIISEVKGLVAEGYKEITLLGQNVNSYGNGSDEISFAELLRKISAIEGDFRLRFMTSHPKDFSEELAEAIASCDKISKCVHLPVQSGSDRILKAMNRKYTVADYIKKIEILHKYVPDCAVTTDLIVGFPGETEEDFQSTLELVKKVDYSSAFTFVYSRREGTVAAKMAEQIPEEISKNRIMRLVSLVNGLTRKHSCSYVGKTVEILCEGYDEKKDMYLGRDTYGRMGYFKCAENAIGKFINLKVTSANGISLIGEKI